MTFYYYESHITIEPIFDEKLEEAKQIAEKYGFKVASLLMQKRKEDTEQRSKYDTFMTAHGHSLLEMEASIRNVVRELLSHGFKIYRYKIEDVVMDSRNEDVLKLLEA
jgi:hypothetical protein